MQYLRILCAAAALLMLASSPLCAATPPNVTPLGTVIAAERAHVGGASADVGTTVYGGDRISTELQGSVQLRAGAARLLLLSSSDAIVNNNTGAPSAQLLSGTATFSTANAHAFTLFVSTAAIRPQTDGPTIAQVTYLNAKELLVASRRGPLTVTVGDDTQVVPEGSSFRVVLDPPEAAAQEPEGAGTKHDKENEHRGPRVAGRSRFLLMAVTVTGVVTALAAAEAFESPARP